MRILLKIQLTHLMRTVRFQMFETFSDTAVTNLLYFYRLIILCKIINLICESSYRKKKKDRKHFQKTQTKMTVPASINPEIMMLWQGVRDFSEVEGPIVVQHTTQKITNHVLS